MTRNSDNRGDAGSGTGGVSTFIDASDTPANYTDDKGKVAKVNSAEDALEFTSSAGVVDLLDWTPGNVGTTSASFEDITNVANKSVSFPATGTYYFTLSVLVGSTSSDPAGAFQLLIDDSTAITSLPGYIQANPNGYKVATFLFKSAEITSGSHDVRVQYKRTSGSVTFYVDNNVGLLIQR